MVKRKTNFPFSLEQKRAEGRGEHKSMEQYLHLFLKITLVDPVDPVVLLQKGYDPTDG